MDEFWDAADAGGDRGDAAGHRFERGEAEGLHLAGHQHQVCEREQLVDVVLLAYEVDAVLHVVWAREIFGDAAVGTVADQHQACRHGFGDAAEDLDNILNALDGAEVGEVDEQALVGFGEARAHGGYQLGVADVDVAVDEVADDLDLGVDLECLAGAVAQVGGDGGDSVGLFDAKLCDGQVRAVEAHERDVGAVQGGDEGEVKTA